MKQDVGGSHKIKSLISMGGEGTVRLT